MISTFSDRTSLIHVALKEDAFFLCFSFLIYCMYLLTLTKCETTHLFMCVNLITSNMTAFCRLATLDTGFAFYMYVYIFYVFYNTFFGVFPYKTRNIRNEHTALSTGIRCLSRRFCSV